MYIAVLQGDINRNRWIAVLIDNDLNHLLSQTTYDSGITQVFDKSAADTLERTGIDLTDDAAAAGSGASKANVYKI